jgi:hypothetical protein
VAEGSDASAHAGSVPASVVTGRTRVAAPGTSCNVPVIPRSREGLIM